MGGTPSIREQIAEAVKEERDILRGIERQQRDIDREKERFGEAKGGMLEVRAGRVVALENQQRADARRLRQVQRDLQLLRSHAANQAGVRRMDETVAALWVDGERRGDTERLIADHARLTRELSAASTQIQQSTEDPDGDVDRAARIRALMEGQVLAALPVPPVAAKEEEDDFEGALRCAIAHGSRTNPQG